MIPTERFYKRCLFLAAVCLLISCGPEPISPASICGGGTQISNHPKAADYQAILDKYVRRGLPGISVSVQDEQGEWIGTAGKADIASNIPMQPCHLMKIASITKMFVATLTMMLVEEGKLSLDDKLTRWLPARVTDRLSNAEEITLFHLLSHQTGLYEFNEDNRFYLSIINNPDRNWTQLDLLEFVYDKPAAFRPGARASYSNINTVLVSMVIERATGRSHAQLMRERILEPLGMNDTFYQGHDKLPEGKVAQGYFDIYNNNTITNVSSYSTGAGNGMGGMLSTVMDLQLFINALFVQKTLVTKQSLEQMMQFSPTSSPTRFLGVGLVKDFLSYAPDGYIYGHSGSDLGYNSSLYWFPERKASLALLVNYGSTGNSSLAPLSWELRFALADKMAQ